MRSPRPFRIAGVLLIAGLLVGCNKQPTGMKDQPPDPNSSAKKIQLPGKHKPFDAGD